jgi:hypothetical protein
LFDNNNHDNATPTVLTDANHKTYCALILLCKVDQQLPNGGGEHDPPDPEHGGEHPIPFAHKKPRRPRGKGYAAKKAAVKKKKAAKKVSKKAAKKGAKKAGKKAAPK